MKKIKNLALLLLMISTVTFMACGGGDDTPPTPAEQQLIDLAGTGDGVVWTATSVNFAGAPSSNFDGMTLTLKSISNAQTYSSNNGDPVFSSSGTWALVEGNINQILVDGISENVFQISNLNAETTPATLRLTVNYTDQGGGIEGTDGTYIFNFESN